MTKRSDVDKWKDVSFWLLMTTLAIILGVVIAWRLIEGGS